MFSAFLELAYEGFVLIDPNDEKQFKEALKVCLAWLLINCLTQFY